MSKPLEHESGHEDRMGQIAMRIIGTAIVGGIITVFAVEHSVDAFPYGVYGLIGACVLAAVSFLVGQVE